MKKKAIKLSIQEPCHEDWSNMTPNEKGKFCDSCAKPVIDFSKASDAEVIQFLDAHKGQKTCGRFKASQLERPMFKYEDSKTLSSFNLRAVMFGATLTSLLGLESCRSEEEIIMGDIAPVEQTQPVDQTNGGVTQTAGPEGEEEVVKMGEVAMEEYDHTNEKLMTGMVVSVGGAKVTHARLMVYDEAGKEVGKTFSKDDGSFRLELNWDKKPSYVVVSADEFIANTIYLKYIELLQEMKVTLYQERMTKGEIQVEEH